MDNRFVFKKVAPQNVNNNVQPISLYLKEQERLLTELDKVISQEFQALKDKQVMLLKPLSEQKSHLMVKLQSNDQKLKLHPDVALLKTEYAAEVTIIKNMMTSCKYQNEVNGKLITMCMQSNNRLHALLVGVRDVVTKNMTYNAKGNASARGPVRLSVEA